jgi:hypothetical protein
MAEGAYEVTSPKLGDRTICRACGLPIFFVGPAWKHQSGVQPRHIAQPYEPEALPPNPYAPAFPLLMLPDPFDGVRQASITIDLPEAMCPRSGNPRPGSALTLTPLTSAYPEVYAVAARAFEAAQELVGGFGGDEGRPAVRSMEGAVAHVARAVAALLGVEVDYHADLTIAVAGGRSVSMDIRGTARP